MTLRTAAPLLFLTLAFPGLAATPAPLPRPLLVPHEALDPAWLAGATWSAWRVGGAPRAPIDLKPASSAGWSVAVVLDDAGGSAEWIVVGEGDGRAASVLVRSGEIPEPAAEIRPPLPGVVTAPLAVDLTWPASSAPGLIAWRVEATQDGSAWSAVGAEAAPDATAVSVAMPEGAWAWRLVPVLAGGVVAGADAPPTAATRVTDGDLDDDGVADASDACRVFADADQRDSDGDGLSDACELTWGDVAPRGRPDGLLGIGDVVVLLRLAVGLETAAPSELRAADVAPALVVRGLPDRATPRLAGPAAIGIDDAVLVLRASVGLARIDAPR